MTAWQQWEDELDDRDRSASSSAPAAEPRNERVRGGRGMRRRERRQAARYGQRAARRRYLGDAEATPGVAVLIGALLVVGVVVPNEHSAFIFRKKSELIDRVDQTRRYTPWNSRGAARGMLDSAP